MIIDGRSLNALATDSSAPASHLDKIVKAALVPGKDGAVNIGPAPTSLEP
jgi:hypothetical protein